MRVIDAGHFYGLRVLDGFRGEESFLRFVKREGAKYPRNVINGADCQTCGHVGCNEHERR